MWRTSLVVQCAALLIIAAKLQTCDAKHLAGSLHTMFTVP
jgi:hypothetical protein